ncbi:MAG: tetratricopeptide repeat protein [Ilyomonas sp.]
MKKQQYILLSFGLVLFVLLFFFGRTVPDKKKELPVAKMQANAPAVVTTEDIIKDAKSKLTTDQVNRITQLENSVVRGDVKNQQIKVYNQLADFWDDSSGHHILGAYYTGKAAELENSEKKLNFAARLLTDEMMMTDNPPLQTWLATNAKELFEQSLKINPNNDSAKVAIGACYLFGNIADNPMQGIMAIREVVEKDPDNMYGQMMLGLGDIKSNQLDKAIERFTIVVNKQPHNLEAIFHLAETYDRKGDKPNAIKWYRTAANMVAVPEAKKELENRIKALQ